MNPETIKLVSEAIGNTCLARGWKVNDDFAHPQLMAMATTAIEAYQSSPEFRGLLSVQPAPPHPKKRHRAMTNEAYRLEGKVIHKNPITTKIEGGEQIVCGFPVCTVSAWVDAETVRAILEANESRAQTPSTKAADVGLSEHPLIKFLLGEGEYKGLWFGDHVMRGKYKANYWWRSDLRALAAMGQEAKPTTLDQQPQSGEVRIYTEAEVRDMFDRAREMVLPIIEQERRASKPNAETRNMILGDATLTDGKQEQDLAKELLRIAEPLFRRGETMNTDKALARIEVALGKQEVVGKDLHSLWHKGSYTDDELSEAMGSALRKNINALQQLKQVSEDEAVIMMHNVYAANTRHKYATGHHEALRAIYRALLSINAIPAQEGAKP